MTFADRELSGVIWNQKVLRQADRVSQNRGYANEKAPPTISSGPVVVTGTTVCGSGGEQVQQQNHSVQERAHRARQHVGRVTDRRRSHPAQVLHHVGTHQRGLVTAT